MTSITPATKPGRNTGVTTLVRRSDHVGQKTAVFAEPADDGAKNNMYSRILNGLAAAAGPVMARLTLIAVIVATAMVASGHPSERALASDAAVEAVFGTVVAVSIPNSITVATNSQLVKLVINDDDVISGQGIETLDDLGEGDKIVATARRQADGTLIADRVLVQPVLSKPVTKHIFGVVVETEAGLVVIQDQDGNLVTLDVTSGIELPHPGEAVTAVASLDRGTGRLEARAFQSVADTVRRIEEAAETASDGERARLAEAAEEARVKHLSVLQQAREALERAREALVNASGSDVTRAEARLLEVQVRYELVRTQYEDAARAADRPAPNLRLNGTLTYRPGQWSSRQGFFSLVPRGADGIENGAIEFAFTPDTMVTFTVIDGDQLSPAGQSPSRTTDAVGVSAGVVYRHSAPTRLSNVKSLVQSGSAAIVVYSPDQRPLTALEIIVLPTELGGQVSDAIEAERLRSFQGVITLVEQTVDTDGLDGIVVVASDARGEKVVAIVTPNTDITLDGFRAEISALAAGHNVDVVFEPVGAGNEDSSTGPLRGRFRAAAIDARSAVDRDEIGVIGVIRDIDPTNRELVIVTRSGSIKAVVPESTWISLNGVGARVENLRVGDFVLDGTRYNRRTGEVTRLVALSPREQAVRGTIVGLAVDPTRVVVSTGGSDVINLIVNDRTKLTSENGSTLAFRSLEVGQLVVKGAYEIVNRDSATYLLATSLTIAESQVIVANGYVRAVDASPPLLHVVVARSTSASDGPLSLELSARSILNKNGQLIRSLEMVEPGDIVDSVAYSASTNTIVKLSVSTPNLIQVRGTVAQVSSNLENLVVLSADGRRISLRITSTTKLSQNGKEITSLRGVAIGDSVSEATYIAASDDRTAGAALSVTIMSRQGSISPTSPDVPAIIETTVSGVIDGYERGAWMSISGRRFRVSPQTEFFGAAPVLGLVAKASLRLGPDSVFVATAVSVAGRPDENPVSRPIDVTPVVPDASGTPGTDAQFRVDGFVGSIEVSAEVSSVVIDQLRVVLTRDTRIDGMVEVGSRVTAVLSRAANGSLTAVEVVVANSSSASIRA